MSWGGGLAARVVACVVAMMVMLTGTFAAYSYADDTIPDFFSNPLGAIQTAFARATGRAVANATWEVDPSTADDWYKDLTTASEAEGKDVLSSKNVGRVWTDKTVFGSEAVLTNHENDQTITITNDDPNSALVALSALSSTMTIEGETEIEPLDIVLVLDTSNGMNDTMNSFAYSAEYSPQPGETYYVETDNGVYEAVTHNGTAWVNDEGDVFVPKKSEGDTTEGSVAFLERTPTSQQKMDALKDAATNFINQTASANAGITDPANRHRVSIVKYGGAASDNIGNDMNNTTMGEENATQIVKEFTECTGQGTTDLIEAVGGLRQQGSTSALDLGLEKADEVLDGGRASAKKVVIVFTGSYPTHTSINPADSPMVVYGNAVEAASQIKADDNTVIYNIGVFAGANPSDTSAYGVNQALNGVSSKYPDASVDKTNPYAPTINLGEPSDEGEFYFAANNTDELNNIFNLIRQSIESQAESPLAAGQGGSGSITFTDTTGAYTEVKDFKSIVFAGVQYDQKTSSTSEDGKVTTYTFTQSVTNPNPVYPNAGALNSIQIKVTHSDDLATGDTVEVVIPDTLLPMRHYQASIEEGVITTDSDPAYPIRVFYTVGVKDEALNTLADPDAALGTYMEKNKGQTDCQVRFYSNDYADQANGKTTAVFEPSTENSFYYFAEDTPVLTNNNLQDYESGASHLVGEIDPNATYYWVNRYIVEGKNDWQYEFVAFQGSELAAENTTTDPDTGRVLIKAGTPHADRPSTFTTQKDENKTNTADNAISPSWSGEGAVTVALGNNGRVTHAVPGIIEVHKDVDWGDGTKDASKEFTFTLLLGDEANTEDVAGTFSYEVYTDGSDDPVRTGTIVDGGTFTLKDGEHVVINGVPAGTSYKIVETAAAGFKSDQANDAVSGTTVCKKTDTYTFTNTYTVEPVTLPGQENLPVSKTLSGLSWDYAPEFNFTLAAGDEATTQAVNDGAVTITSGSTTVSKDDVTQGTTGTAYFGDDKTGITFTKPGDYVFTVSEIIPDSATNPGVNDGATQYKDATAEQKAMAGWQLDGITYTNATHTLTFHVTDDGDGTMTVTPDAGNPDVVFSNGYRATGSATLSAVKAITGRDFQAGDAFTFTVEGTYKGDATVDSVPLPDGAANGSITIQPTAGETSFAFDLGTIAFTAPGTYIYTLTESDQGLPAGVGHDKTVYTVTYVVEDNHKGELTVQGGKPTIQVGDETKDAISWTNAYDPADATETVTASKTLTGRDSLPDEEFTFTLMPTGDTVQAVKDGKITGIDAEKGATVSIGELKNGVAKDGSFGELTFTEAGEYTFEITENRPADATEASNYTHNGVTYDATTGTVTITVTDLDDEGNNTGQLVANVEYGTTTETDNVFINTYKPTPTTGKVALSGTKTVDDQIGTFQMTNDQFAFSFAPADNAPMPDPEKTQVEGVTFVTQNYGGANHTVAKVTNTGTKGLTSKFDFSKLEIPFTQAGEYQYYVVEDDTLTWEGAPNVVPGISYDGTQYRVTFAVTEDQATGALSASISKVEVRGANDQWTEVATNELNFKNVYSAEVKQNRQINKTLNGRNFIDSDTLQFDVEVTAIDHTNGDAPIAGADIPTPAGTFGATMSTPVVDAGKVTYSFTVDPTVGTNTATFNTGDVTYTHVGTYTYKISEHYTGAASVAYDTSEYVITVKVAQVNENGQVVLKPETTITKDGETYSLMQLYFVNTYTTNGELDGDTYLKVSKTVANRPWNDGESFGFTITAKTGPNNMAVKDIPMPASSELKLSKNGDEATVAGAFGDIAYTVPGTYTYEIAEKSGTTGGLTYSGAKYTVTVTATDRHDGTMDVSATMTRTANDQGVGVSGNDAVVEDSTAAFTNTYTPGTATLVGATDLVVSKGIDGRGWQQGDTFSFTLAADVNHAETKAALDAGQITMSRTTATIANTSPAGTPDNTRTASFGNITFTKAGTYQFIVTEDVSTVNGVDRPTDYDRTVVVEVSENKLDGTMTAKLADTSEELAFTNVYNPDPLTLAGNTALKVQKTLPGAAWANGSFVGRNWTDDETFGFTIARTDDGAEDAVTMPADTTATVDKPADGSVNTAKFGGITFNEPGTYTFKITETEHNGEVVSADPQNGMTYDRHTATVTVVVDDNKTEGKLVATSVTYNNDDAPSQTDASNDDIAAFTNTYTAASDSYTNVSVAKVLTGRDWKGSDSFTFDLAFKSATNLPQGAPQNADGLYALPGNAANLSVTNKGSALDSGDGYSAQYGAITFYAPGLYTFTVTEDVPAQTNGITYDASNPKEFTVQVTDNGQGQLEASLADDSSSNLQFTNSYAATGTLTGSTYLKVAKNLPATRPWGDGDTFTMQIEAISNTAGIDVADMPTPADATVELTKNAQSGSFDSITFIKAGTYVYHITEQRPTGVGAGEKVNGLIYSRAVYEVTVTVEDNNLNGTFDVSSTMTRVTNSDGTTPATPATVESNTATFRNDYQPTGQLVGADSLRVSKTLEGRSWDDGETYTFQLEGTGSAPMPDGAQGSTITLQLTKPADGKTVTGSFGNITFTSVTTSPYTYSITETGTDANGVTFSKAEYQVSVTVTDPDHNGVLDVQSTMTKVKADNGDEVAGDAATVADNTAAFTNTYEATGTLSGAQNLEVTKVFTGRDNDEWLDDDSFEFTIAPNGETTQKAVESGAVTMPDQTTITIGKTDVNGDGAHAKAFGDITFKGSGEATYQFSITETDSMKGGIKYDTAPRIITVKVTDNGTGTLTPSIEKIEGGTSNNLTFTNLYGTSGDLAAGSIEVTKAITGRDAWNENESYSFSIALDQSDEFTMNSAQLIQTPAAATIAADDEDKAVSFDAITFGDVPEGVYRFIVTENGPAGDDDNTLDGVQQDGVTYDDTSYRISVKVEDNDDGGLTATLVDPESGEPLADNKTSCAFENSYAAFGELPSGTITVTKNFTGRPNDEWLDTDAFTFALAGGDKKTADAIAAGDIVLPEGVSDTGITIVDGTADHKAAFGAIQFGDVADGDYTFTVTEQKVENNGITYADPQTVTVTVTDNNDGTLKVEPKDGSNELTFTNIYKAAETTATLNVEKVVTGADAPEDFEFALDFADDNKGPEDGVSGLTGNTATVAGADLTLADGAEQDAETASFGELTFSKAGVYTFAITETTDDYGNGWSYDNDDPNTVAVTVEDNDNGALVVTGVEYTDEDTIAVDTDTAATFTNRYTAGAAMVNDLSVTKQVEGNATDEDFIFKLTLTSDNAANIEGLGEGNKVTATATGPFSATANKEATQKVTFSPLTFTEPGDYTFTVAETNTAPENTSWIYGADNSNGQQITVKVRDNGKGALVADGTDPAQESGIEGNNPTIVNRYKATGTATITVEKVIRNRDWLADDRGTEEYEGDSFDFALTVAGEETKKAVENGNVVMPTGDDATTTVTSDTVDHKAAFGEITFNVPGTYTFDVTEQGQNHDGLTYDTTPKQVAVKVVDNGDGMLTATVQDNNANHVAGGVVTITNTYNAGGTVSLPEDGIDLTKVLKGRAWNEDDALTFAIAGASATAPDGETAIDPIPMPEATQVTLGYDDIAKGDDGQPATTEEGWNYADLTFGAITFSQPGTYVYTVTEADTGNAGMTEPAPAEVTITVTDNLHGGYAATVTSVTGSPLVNVYGTQLDYSDAGGLTIVKTMSNQDIAEGEFGFTVTPDDAASAALLGLDADTWKAGQGKEFFTHAADLEIDVNGNGVATASITVLDNAAFTHEHDGSTYGFTIAETKAAEGNGYAKDITVYHVAIAVADDAQGTLTATTKVTVTTADPAHPHDAATYTYTNTGEGAADPAQVTFTNDYDAQGALGEGGIKATKTLANGQLAGNDFGFSVYDATGAKVAGGTNAADGTITLGAIGYSTDQLMWDVLSNAADYVGKVDGKDTYTYAYTVREDTDAATGTPLDPNGNVVPGVTVNAGSFQITVTVTDNGNGELSAQVTYPQDTDHLVFRNTYGTVPGGAETLLVGGRKALDTGTTSGENVPTLADIADKYTFKIQGSVVEGEDGPVPMPERTTATNDAAGNVTFGNIEFSIESVWGVQTDAADGETADGGVATQSVQRTKRFQYLVSEEGDVPGITNGVAQAFFVTVTDNGDGTVDVKCTSGNTGSTIELTPGEQFTITNEYRVAPVESSVTDAVSITKTLDGRALNEGEFTFDMALVSAPGETNPGFSVLTATNDADGAVSFPKLTFSQVGTYVYRISEEHGDLGGIAYDDSTYTATATVTDNGDGTLSVEWAVTDADGQTVGKKGVIFANTYTADPATVGLAATKVLGGRELKDGEFTFELARTGEDAPMPGDAQEDTIRLTNAADGTIAIDPIIFTQPGEYRYTLREVNGDAEGVTYDDAEHVITVTVTDNLAGALEADVSIDDGAATGIVFTNTYTAPAESDMPASGSAVAGTAVIAAMLLIAAAGIGVASKRSASRRGSNR